MATRQDSFVLCRPTLQHVQSHAGLAHRFSFYLDPVSNLQLSNILRITEELETGSTDKTKLSCLVYSCVHTADTDKTSHKTYPTRQFDSLDMTMDCPSLLEMMIFCILAYYVLYYGYPQSACK